MSAGVAAYDSAEQGDEWKIEGFRDGKRRHEDAVDGGRQLDRGDLRLEIVRRWVNRLVWRVMEKTFAGLPLTGVGGCLDPTASVVLRLG